MPLARAVPIVLSLAAGVVGAAGAQYRQPWVGEGIHSRQESVAGQVLVPQHSSGPAGRDRGVEVAPAATRFTVRVENIATGEVLKLSDGTSAPFVSAPVLWVVHTGSTSPIFTGGAGDAGDGLERLAETGDPSQLAGSLARKPAVVAAGAVARPVSATTEGPLTPGQRYEFEIAAEPGQLLSAAWMFGQSNDLFYANDRPIALFDAAGKPVSAELTTQLSLWDAGTEVNEEPGLGPNQGPRQSSPDAGVAESQGIAHVADKYTYPRISEVLRVTISPATGAVSTK